VRFLRKRVEGNVGMSLRVRSVIIILLVVILDRVSKLYIRASFAPWDVAVVIPGVFNIVHAENPGAAFSMLAEAPPIIRAVLLVGVSMGVMSIVGVMLWRLPKNAGGLMFTSLALVFGGAFGNLWDRVVRGSVTDFLQVFIGSYEFPAFNVADSAITIGAALLLLDLVRNRKAHRAT
jgi:signal peptidase II